MRKSFVLLLLALMAMSVAAQADVKPTFILGPGLDSGRTPYYQTWNRTLSADTLYILTGLYYIEPGYQIEIPAGTICQGDTAATLIVKPDAQIFATGTADQPIVFTSLKAPGEREPGDWGGIVLLGNAPTNQDGYPVIEGGLLEGTYGGGAAGVGDPDDSSGILRYVRIQYPGYRFQLNNEINGLTMGGVGRGTELHHIQVSYAFDDSYEWFGGTVDAHHLVALGGTDDEFDTDFGYQGRLQFCFGLRDPEYSDPTGQSNGFESDNEGSSSSTADPHTRPVFSNVTLIGPQRTDALPIPGAETFQFSGVLRRSTQTSIYNSVIAGYPWGFSIRDPFTIQFCLNNTLMMRNVSVTASLIPTGSTSTHDESRWAGVTAWFDTPGFGNIGSTPRLPSTVGFTNMTSLIAPNPAPVPGSELDNSADFTYADLQDPYFTPVTYRGAFAPGVPMDQQWTAGWTNFNPQYYNAQTAAPEGTPVATRLHGNFPNPFNPKTEISFSLPDAASVTLKVYDVTGRLVRELSSDQAFTAGTHTVVWDGRDANAQPMPSGVYFYQMQAGDYRQVRKMTMLK